MNLMKEFKNPFRLLMRLSVVFGLVFLVSCKDDYIYDEKSPDWLGESIYDYLKQDGHFDYYVKIIEDVGQKEVLAKTGSKTLFVTPDSIFDRFFQDNVWGLKSFEEMNLSQKRQLLFFSMIDNAYLIETLSNYYSGGVLNEGQAMRRLTGLSVLDSVPFIEGNKLPKATVWNRWRTKGMYLLKDNSTKPMVHFLQKYLENVGISDQDFKVMTGADRSYNDAFIFQHKVIKRDIVCKNGYVNVLDGVMIPRDNMAEYIRSNENTTQFSELLDRFCAPYHTPGLTATYNNLHPEATIDSIFYLRYFAPTNQGGVTSYPNGSKIPDDQLLPYDPGWNSYAAGGTALQSDMGVIFAPTNEALDYYFNEGSGRELKKRYGSWDGVPNDILVLLITRHMRKSLVNSFPGLFHKMVDEASSPLNVLNSDIVDSLNYVGVNGLVYVTSSIYPPDDFVSVYSPVLFSEKTLVLDWGIKRYLYRLYLNSMVSKYAFVIPTDKALERYIDPYTYNSNFPTVLKFFFNKQTSSVNVSVFNYDKVNDVVLDSVTTLNNANFIRNRLTKILDQSIVVGDFKDDPDATVYRDGYYVTKDGNILYADGTADIDGSKLTSNLVNFSAGADIENGTQIHLLDSGIFYQKNGTSFMVDQLPQTPLQSFYTVLSDSAKYPEFDAFFSYCENFPGIFEAGRGSRHFMDFNVTFFNTYRYTVYIPSNAAMEEAFNSGLIIPWDSIAKIESATEYNAVVDSMQRFIRYHFQDNSLFIHPNQVIEPARYYTATIKNDDSESYFNTYKNKFYRIQAEGDGTGITLTTEYIDKVNNKPYTAKVDVNARTPDGRTYYNIMTRDYVFNSNPKNLTGLTTSAYSSSEVTTSSTAVVHLIDRVLRYR